MKTLTQLIKEVPEGMNWLLRSGGGPREEEKEGKFLANVTDATFNNSSSQGSHPVWADSPEEALEASIAKAKAANQVH